MPAFLFATTPRIDLNLKKVLGIVIELAGMTERKKDVTVSIWNGLFVVTEDEDRAETCAENIANSIKKDRE